MTWNEGDPADNPETILQGYGHHANLMLYEFTDVDTIGPMTPCTQYSFLGDEPLILNLECGKSYAFRFDQDLMLRDSFSLQLTRIQTVSEKARAELEPYSFISNNNTEHSFTVDEYEAYFKLVKGHGTNYELNIANGYNLEPMAVWLMNNDGIGECVGYPDGDGVFSYILNAETFGNEDCIYVKVVTESNPVGYITLSYNYIPDMTDLVLDTTATGYYDFWDTPYELTCSAFAFTAPYTGVYAFTSDTGGNMNCGVFSDAALKHEITGYSLENSNSSFTMPLAAGQTIYLVPVSPQHNSYTISASFQGECVYHEIDAINELSATYFYNVNDTHAIIRVNCQAPSPMSITIYTPSDITAILGDDQEYGTMLHWDYSADQDYFYILLQMNEANEFYLEYYYPEECSSDPCSECGNTYGLHYDYCSQFQLHGDCGGGNEIIDSELCPECGCENGEHTPDCPNFVTDDGGND